MDRVRLDFLETRLAQAQSIQQRRFLKVRSGADFSSNDYLGFAEDLELSEAVHRDLHNLPVGAAGSRLLRGNLDLHEEVERQLAEFCGTESALLFPSGYQANIGLLSALLTEKDHIFSDEFNHASLIDGVRLGRSKKYIFKHNDIHSLEEMLNAVDSAGAKFIVTESLFSMDGDFAPLRDLTEIAQKYGALLIVDESHATGVYGDFASHRGGGLVQELRLREKVFATLHTGGKALGVAGAWVAGPTLLRESLVNFSRPFIFSTAIAPGVTAALGAAVRHWKKVGASRAQEVRMLSRNLIDIFGTWQRGGVTFPTTPSLILPILVGSNGRALRLSERLQEEGLDVRAIRPPTVPEGTARVRLTIKWNSSSTSIENLIAVLSRALECLEPV